MLAFYMPTFNWLSEIPKAFFHPPFLSIASLFPTFPGKEFFLVLDGIVLASLVCVVMGIKARASSLVFCITCLIGLNFQYSLGKISHTILAYLLFGCFAFSGWGRYLAVWKDKESKLDNPAKCLSLFAVLLCFGMFTAGFEKALQWIDFDLRYNGFLSWSLNSIFRDYKYHLLAPFVRYFPVPVLEVFDYMAVMFELSPLLFLLHSKSSWKVWLLIASVFHFTNALLLNIPYPMHIIVYLAFIGFKWLYNHLTRILSNRTFKWYGGIAISIVVVARLAEIVVGQDIISMMFSVDQIFLFHLYFTLLLWGLVIVLLTKSLSLKFVHFLQKDNLKKFA